MKRFGILNKRSLTAMLLGLAMICSLTGCNKDGGVATAGGKETNTSGLVYKAEPLNVQMDDADSVVNFKEVDGVLHILAATYAEEAIQYKLIKYNIADQSTTEVYLASAAGGYFSSIFFNEDGSLEVIEIKEEYDEEWNPLSHEMYMNKYDSEGGLISSEEATAKLQLDEGMYISTFIKDAEGNYLIGSWDSPIRIYSPELQLMGEIPNDGSGIMESLCVTETGKIVASGWSNAGNGGVDIAVLDVAGKKLGTPIHTNKTSGSSYVWPGKGDTVYYMNGNLVCSADVVSGEITTVTDIMDMDVNPDNVQAVYALSDDKLLLTVYDYTSTGNGFEMLLARPVDPSEIVEKTELTVATIYTSQDLNAAVIEFNRNNDEYRIKVIDYMTEDYDYDAALTNLQNDIVAGNVPDMIDASSVSAPWRNWASKEIITDLYPLMEADGDFSKEELLPNVRAAYEVNGSLYVLPTTVMLNGVMVKEKFVPGVTSLTPEVLLELESQLPEDADLFWYNYQGEIMYNMVYNNMSSYVDYENGECYFDTDEFKAVLEYAKEQPAEMIWDDSVSLPGQLKEDKVIFYNMTISQMPDWQFHNYVFGEDITVLGYGSEEEGGSNLITNGCALTITEACEHKDVAWDFLKTFVSEEAQTKELLWGIPVTQTGFDNFIYEAQHMNGTHGYGWDDVNMEITSATDEEVEAFLAVFEQADTVSTQDTAIMAIIEEEVAPYFQGQKSVDEVADIIQSRIDIYLKENM